MISGDYKLESDGLSGAFEAVKCHNFITESTFGLPIYKWKPQKDIYSEMQSWIRKKGGLTAKTLLLRGRELNVMYRVCT